MTTQATTLTDFLLARLAEDEADARRIHAERCETPAEVTKDSWGRPMSPTCDCDWHIARVLAEVESKRFLVMTFCEHIGQGDGYAMAAETALRALALPYADHPEFREEWKP